MANAGPGTNGRTTQLTNVWCFDSKKKIKRISILHHYGTNQLVGWQARCFWTCLEGSWSLETVGERSNNIRQTKRGLRDF